MHRVGRMHRDSDRTDGDHRLRDLLRDHAGFADPHYDDLAPAAQDKLRGMLDPILIKARYRILYRGRFKLKHGRDPFEMRI